LQAFLDFKLVICDPQKRTLRVLDDDELLIKVYQGYAKSVKKTKDSGTLLINITKTGFLEIFSKISDYFT
jgi:hypothetical protein